MIRILFSMILLCCLFVPSQGEVFSPAEPVRAKILENESNNGWTPKTSFIVTHTLVAQTNFGFAFPYFVLGSKDFKTYLAANLITLPINFAGHLFFVRNKDFTSSHLKATNLTTTSFLALSYAAPLSFLESPEDGLRIGSSATLLLYPFGIWAGYQMGSMYEQNAGGFAKQSLGIMTHSILGGFVGTELAVLSRSFRSGWESIYPITMGAALGTLEGMLFFRDSDQIPEQHFLNLLGLFGGVIMGSGILMAVDDDFEAFKKPALTTSVLASGAFIGYAGLYFITRGMNHSQEQSSISPSFRVSFNPIPSPEWIQFQGKAVKRYRIPGLTLTLPWL